MIQNVSATQSRQNFGMAVKPEGDFLEKLATKSKKMQDTFTEVEKAQKGAENFDLHVGFDEKNKLTHVMKNKAGQEMIQKHKWSRFILSILPDHLKLKCLSSIITYNDKKLSTLQKIGKKMLSENPEERANGSLVV